MAPISTTHSSIPRITANYGYLLFSEYFKFKSNVLLYLVRARYGQV